MSLSKKIVMEVPSDGSDEEISESAAFPPSFVTEKFAAKVEAMAAKKGYFEQDEDESDSIAESSEGEEISEDAFPSSFVTEKFAAKVEALAAKKGSSFEQDEDDSDSIVESSEGDEVSEEFVAVLKASAARKRHCEQAENSDAIHEPLVAKKQKVDPSEGGQDEEGSLPRKNDQERVKSFEDEVTPDPVSAAHVLKIADQGQERAKESPSEQNEHESSPPKKETAPHNRVRDGAELNVADQQQEQKEKSLDGQTGRNVLLCDKLHEDGPFWKGSGKGRSQSSEASRTSASESSVSTRDAEQEAESSLGQSEQEPSPSSAADEAISVLAAIKDPSHEEEEQKEKFGLSKRKPKAKQFFDHDIDTDEDGSMNHEANARRHFDSIDADYESNGRKPLKFKSTEEYSTASFPEQIYKMVTETAATQPELISWVHDGEAFAILDPKNSKFGDLLEKYFSHRRYSSLQRQLNMYGWQKHLKGKYEGAFYNEQFHRDRGSSADLAVIRRRAPPKAKPGTPKEASPSERPPRLNSSKVSDEDNKRQPAKRASRSKDTASGNEVISSIVQLEAIPKTVPRLDRLSPSESYELELALQFDSNDPDDGWQNDWSGNVALLSRDVTNPLSRSRPSKTELKQPLWEWASTSPQNLQLARNLLRHVYNANGTPDTARRILAHAYHQSMQDPSYNLEPAMKRVAYDPAVLREDGWTTAKTDSPVGVTGGPYHIGLRILWEKWEAVVIAFLHDSDIGDLWKALWLDGNETFDLEAEEMHRGREKWERKFMAGQAKPQESSSTRFAAAAKFTVEGIQHGIVMAKTYNPQARKGLFWPARIMHVSELGGTQPQGKSRSSSKQKLQVIFLAPYWNTTVASTPTLALAGSLSQESSTFSSEPLFEVDTLDASEETIQKYPYCGKQGLNLDGLRAAFRFTGLPKNAFSRFLDSHRLALALKTYAQQELTLASTHSHAASAALTDTHAMAVETAKFPDALLHLPFEYILSHLPRTTAKDSLSLGRNEDHVEPTIQLAHIMHSMRPPACWGKDSRALTIATPPHGQGITPALSAALASPVSKRHLEFEDPGQDRSTTSLPGAKMTDVASNDLIYALGKLSSTTSMSSKLLDQLAYLLSRLRQDVAAAKSCSFSQRRKQLLLFLMACLRTKGQGEDTICSEEFPTSINAKTLLMEWRNACENVFKHASIQFSYTKFGNSVTYVISDSRCNEHITSNGCVERPVRLPAALKGARQAGNGENVEFLLSVGDDYMTLAEQKVIGQAHSSSYLKRMRLKCAAITPGTSGAPLTDDSNGEGGEDTKGSRGSYTAAVAGVAAAIKGVDMILGGQCVNAFCATRPPGHHAGRELHPMKAISNGFCVLNTAACAALYATTPLSEHGPGLKRICVIDFDVHHGNGTQDILCQTHDPRFLYVSMHAGGAHINGYESDENDREYRTSEGRSQRKEDGIFPGRCGDISPHKGVLNIPLGARVTAQNVGNALVSLVGPAVFSFSPDLIIVSAGFDAHKNDPLGMGGLSAEDFGHITDVICSMAYKSCSGRVLSIMEGGYGVPCCRPQKALFLPPPSVGSSDDEAAARPSQQQLRLLDLGRDLPASMEDQVPPGMQKKLDKCHEEGFVDCVREHVQSLAEHNDRSKA